MTRLLSPDICVIGAGSAGLSVAAAARAFGVEVVLIERDRMGGDCLNTGCVPSKALIAAAKAAHAARSGGPFGVEAVDVRIDFAAVRRHIEGVQAAIAPHDSEERFRGLGATVIRAPARFLDARRVAAGDAVVSARRFVVATGSRAKVPAIPGLADIPYLTNETIFTLPELPEHLVVIGAGAVGLELGQAFRRLGSRVTVLDSGLPLAKDDPDCAAVVLSALRREGVDIRGNVVIERVEPGPRVRLAGGEVIAGSHLLVAAGRAPVVDGLDLAAAGIEHGPQGITVGRSLRTSNRRVYAIGDVAGSFQFTHWAGYHAGLAVRQILFRLPARENPALVAWATFTDPEIAHAGLSLEEARRRDRRARVLTVPFSGNDRAQAERRTEGLAKLVVGRGGRILGADVAGAGAAELAGLFALAIAGRVRTSTLAGFIAPYPTYAELAKRLAVASYGDSLKNPALGAIIRLLRAFG